MTAPPGDRGQLDFLQHVQRIFDEGEFVATYKFALLIALVELAIERGDDTGAPLELDLHSIAEKFIEQYWPHAAPYGAAEGAPAVLVQNHGRQAAIVARIAEVRGRFGSLARAKSDRSWRGFAGGIAQIVKEMPLWKLQTLRRRNVPFLYEKSSGPRITLLPGVAFNLRRFGALIQLLARSAWVQHIRANPRNAPTVGGATDLELFLFGGARVNRGQTTISKDGNGGLSPIYFPRRPFHSVVAVPPRSRAEQKPGSPLKAAGTTEAAGTCLARRRTSRTG